MRRFSIDRIAALSLLLAFASVAVTEVLGRVPELQDLPPYEDLRTEEQREQAVNWVEHRREYVEALRIYQRLLSLGVQGLEPPTMNDADSITRYIDPVLLEAYLLSLEEEQDLAAPLPSALEIIAPAEPPRAERVLLRSLYRSRHCPESLRQSFLEGFFDLCVRLSGGKAVTMPPSGIISDIANIRRQRAGAHGAAPDELAPRSLNFRLKVQSEAQKIERRSMPVPLRFQNTYMEQGQEGGE